MPNRQEITTAIDALIDGLDANPGVACADLHLERVNRHHWRAHLEIESTQLTADAIVITITPHKEHTDGQVQQA